MKIYPIVEGHAEVAAVPVLLRRLLAEAQCYGVTVGRPIRRKQAEFRSREPIQAVIRVALLQPDCAAIVLLFDGEDTCPKELSPTIRSWAREAAGSVPCDVVIAYREYETWFLTAIESLRGRYGIHQDASPLPDPESRRDAKGAIEEYMPGTRVYSETRDQPGMSETFDMGIAYRRNRSFRKLVKAVGYILSELRQPIPAWPPTRWTQEEP